MIYGRLICRALLAGGEQFCRLDAAGSAERVHGDAQALVDGVRGDAELARGILDERLVHGLLYRK